MAAVPAGARFSLTRDYPDEIARVGVIEPAVRLAWASGVDTLQLVHNRGVVERGGSCTGRAEHG